MSKNLRALSSRKGIENNLFLKIQKYNIPTDILSEEFLIGESSIIGTRNFYDFLKEDNKEKKVFICNGTSCITSGKQERVKTELRKHFSDNEIGHVSCLGHCHTNAAFLYNEQTYSLDKALEVKDIINNKEYNSNKEYQVYNLASQQILTKKITNKINHYQLIDKFTPHGIVSEVKKSQLQGRGGAGFPFGLKLESCINTKSEQKYIVCNADEGDPGAYSDMYLLEQNPHLVLFGMMAAGKAVGANWGILYIRAEYPNSIISINNEIELLQKENIIGEEFNFKIIKGAGAYICGEETALLNSIEGIRPEVRVRPPFPTQDGLYGKPTILSNVETFANLHWILENGGDSFSKIGSEKSKGTKLISLDGFFKKPGIYEVDMGYPFSNLLKIADGFIEDIKAIQFGGPLGGILPINEIMKINLDFESFSNKGFLFGHASAVCIPKTFPMIEFIKHLFEFTKDESCGKCYPCRLGSARGYELIEGAMNRNETIDNKLLNDLLETMELGSLCALGGGLPLPIRNIIKYFNSELKSYLQ